MKKLFLLIITTCIASLGAWAQTSSVSATITDSTSQAYANGTYDILFRPAPGVPGTPTRSGSAFTQHFSGVLDASGAFAVTLTRNDFIQPGGSQWTFTICPLAASACFTSNQTIAAASVNLTSALHTVTPIVSVFALGNIPSAYSSSEIVVTPNPGSFFWNLTTGTFNFWNGSSWVAPLLLPSGNITFTGTNLFTGSNTVCKLNGAFVIDPANACGWAGTDWVGWFNSAVTALGASGGAIHFQKGVYAAASTSPSFSVPLVITGDGTGVVVGVRSTVLTLAPGVSGFQCLTGAQLSHISDLYILSQSTVSGSDIGIQVQCHALKMDNVVFDHFGKYGVSTDTSVTGNSNNSTYTNVRAINNLSHGFYFNGVNSNAGTCINCDASSNGGDGFNINTVSNWTFLTAHSATNAGNDYTLASGASNFFYTPYCEVPATMVISASANRNFILQPNYSKCTITNNDPTTQIYVASGSSLWQAWNFLYLTSAPGSGSAQVYGLFDTAGLAINPNWLTLTDQTNSQSIAGYDPSAKVWHWISPVAMVADNAAIGGVNININAPVGATNPHNYQWNSGSFSNSWLALSDLTAPQNIEIYDSTNKIWGWSSGISGIGWNRAAASDLLMSPTAPTIAGAGCGGASASIPNSNGASAFEINVGTTPTSTCTVTMPAATTKWAGCTANDITNSTTGGGYFVKLTGGTNTTAVFTFYSTAGAATAPTASDVIRIGGCFAY